MANYDLAFPGAAIDAILTTAYDLQNAGYIFKGSATAYSGTPTQRTWLLAPAGFSGYGFSSAIPKGSIGICRWTGSAWVGDVINVVTIDSTVTNGSTNPVSGDAVWDAMDELAIGIRDTLLSFTITDGTASADQASKLTYDVKMTDGQGVLHLIGSFNILAATAYKAGLMSAADKAKVDAFLTNLRSLSFTDTTPSGNQGTQLVETLKATIGGTEETITALTILAATTTKAGLLSAADKSYLDGLPTSLSTISASISKLLAMLGYYECSTAAATAAKTVSASGYTLTTGGCIRIKMTNANTADSVTLNINSTGAKALYYDGAQASSTNSWDAGEVLEVYYDGTQYQCASGGGGKFATGEKVKETSITDEVTPNSDALVTSGAVDEVVKEINDEIGVTQVLTSSDFVQGTLDPPTGGESNRTDRIRTGYIKVKNGYKIDYILHSQSILFYYYTVDKTYISATSWINVDGTVNIEEDGYIRILIKIADRTEIVPSQLAAEISIINPNSITGSIAELSAIVNGISEEVEHISDSIYKEYQFVSEDFEQGTVDPADGSLDDSTTRIRTKETYQVAIGDKLTFTANGQYWIIDYYDVNGNFLSATTWTNANSVVTIENNGRVRILVRKSNNSSTITPSELAVVIVKESNVIPAIVNDVAFLDSRLTAKIEADETRITNLEGFHINYLFLGTLVNKQATASGLSNSTERVTTLSNMVVPFVGATISIAMPDTYRIGIRSGASASNLSYNDWWIYNGESYTFRNDVRYFRLTFAKYVNSNIREITVSEVQTLIDSGDIRITINKSEIDVISRNAECEKYVKAAMRPFVSGSTNNGSLNKLPVFSHISDIHGDAKRFDQFMAVSDFLKVDAALISGDMLAIYPVDSKQFIEDIVSKHTSPDLQCLGNHECLDNDIQTESEMIASCIDRNECVVNNNEAYPTYYYKDIASKNIRVISLNIYDGGSGNANWRLSQIQFQWLADVLAATPANYGVLLMAHSPESIPTVDANYPTFRQPILNYTTTGAFQTKPLAHVIDSFIGKTAETITYTLEENTINITTNFTNLNTGVEFIAYVNGHLHTDTIGYLPDTLYKQLVLNVNCGVSVYGPTTYPWLANNSDIPRDGEGSTQDSFNIYAIDKATGTVRIAKYGSNVTGAMTDRKWMVIPYKD